jgi:hypothetical protein
LLLFNLIYFYFVCYRFAVFSTPSAFPHYSVSLRPRYSHYGATGEDPRGCRSSLIVNVRVFF